MRPYLLAILAGSSALLSGCATYGYGDDARDASLQRLRLRQARSGLMVAIMPTATIGTIPAITNGGFRRTTGSIAADDGRYYCRRSDGTTGLIVGGIAGGVLGNIIADGSSGDAGDGARRGGGRGDRRVDRPQQRGLPLATASVQRACRRRRPPRPPLLYRGSPRGPGRRDAIVAPAIQLYPGARRD